MPLPALPPLHLVRALHAVGHSGSIRRGAAALGLSHTVVSRHLRALEAWVGAKLLERTPRGARLTPEGETVFAATETAFAALSGAFETIAPRGVPTSLRVWAMPGLAGRWLGPRLAEIERLLPGLDVSIRATETPPDFEAHEADLFIGFAPDNALPVNAERLVTPRMFPVASPAWLARNGRPASLSALAGQSLIHERDHSQWERWLTAAGVEPSAPLSGPKLWTASLGLDAAAAHQGIALATQLSVAREIGEGQLVELFDTDIATGSYFLLAAPERRNKSPVLAFREWLGRQLNTDTETETGNDIE
ncbi:LysR substrate-binding domain-containing protein [Stappia sp. ES.058]|uniref:LysR substrate-binding domain-containing protein n=1 Tax=Stappia sp. ES.058 TaxID=1881061 RepID=UPI00087DCB4F|nr:LysR substrate-binding domain-containing protein [Stappia sp. ES.058]SDT90729.1 DNA-binding transcriptional regulator, LysR family [Stappia sp. ES.058]